MTLLLSKRSEIDYARAKSSCNVCLHARSLPSGKQRLAWFVVINEAGDSLKCANGN